jgi:hypothetical protein
MPSSSERYIALRDGPVVPADALCLLWSLADRGVTVTRQDDRLRVTPARAVTPTDLQRLRRWRADVLAIVRYLERDDLDAHLRSAVH